MEARIILSGMKGLILVLLLSGCANSNSPQPVSGKVFFRNKPAEGAVVTFHSQSGDGKKYSAVALENGIFHMTTRKTFDGLPAGKYTVTIFYLSPGKKVDGQNAGPDLLSGKYADPASSSLKVEIKNGPNDLEAFNLN